MTNERLSNLLTTFARISGDESANEWYRLAFKDAYFMLERTLQDEPRADGIAAELPATFLRGLRWP